MRIENGQNANKVILGSQGGAHLLLLIGVLFAVLPMIFVSANDTIFKSYNDLYRREKLQKVSDDFVGAMLTSARGAYACTKNLASVGLIGQPYMNLQNLNFSPKAITDYDKDTLQPGEGQLAPTELMSDLKVILQRNMESSGQTDLEVKASTLTFCDPNADANCPKPLNSSRVVIFRWNLRFETLGIASIASFSRSIYMTVGIDSGSKIVGCKLSLEKSRELLEDRICKTLAPACGTNGYSMTPTSGHPDLVFETCLPGPSC